MQKPPLRPNPALNLQITGSPGSQVQATLLREVEASQAVHAELDTSHANSARLEGQLSNLVNAFGRQVTGFVALVAGRPSQEQLIAATKQMQETQMSFNLQYLQLQTQMQHENRSYTAISNILKTRHDTVKNSISNIR
jgi:uncharacterized protein YcgI (DUF1989 family)